MAANAIRRMFQTQGQGQYGNEGVIGYIFGNATLQQMTQTPMTMSTQHNQVDFMLLSKSQQTVFYIQFINLVQAASR